MITALSEDEWPATLRALKERIKDFVEDHRSRPTKICVPRKYEARLLKLIGKANRPTSVLSMEPVWDAEDFSLE